MVPGRDEHGRYIKGHKSNGGRKPRAVEESYLDIMLGEVSPEDWRRITAKAKEQAMRGDAVARKWLSDYIIGPPIQRTDITTDGEPLQFIEKVIEATPEDADEPDEI